MTTRQIRPTADSGTTDGTTANKLVDSSQNFLTTVVVGMVVLNTTDTTRALVSAVDSDGILSLDADIMTSGEGYTVGGDFTSASAWEAARGGGTLSAPEEGECFSFSDTTILTINGTTTSAANFMRLFAADGSECGGFSRDQTADNYQLKTTGTLTIGDDHVRIDGIEVQGTTSSSKTIDITAISAGSDVRVENNLITNVGTSSGTFCVDASEANLTLLWRNNLVVTQQRCCDFRGATVTTDHSGFYGDTGQLGVVSDAGNTVTNSWCMNSNDDWFDGGTDPTGNNNASEDTSADPLFSSSLDLRTRSTEFVSDSHTTSSFDFTLESGNTIGGAGTDPSGLTDIAGTAYANPSSIGPFAEDAPVTLTADSGSYIYSGTNATLTFTPTGEFDLEADSGSYSYTGTNVDLLVGRVLVADSGSYTYTGTAAGLFSGLILSADTGAYVYTGTGVDFVQQRVLSADSGLYVYAGTIANIFFTPLPPDVPEAKGVNVEGVFGDGFSATSKFGTGFSTTSSFGTGVNVEGDL